MKFINIICSLFMFFYVSASEAQMNRYGNNSQFRETETKKPEKVDPIQTSVDFLTKELSLDVFQVSAVRVYLTEHQNESLKVVATNSSDGEKTLKIQKVNELLNKNIKSILTEDQVVKFDEIAEKKNSPKKGKKGKKSKNKNEKTE